MEIYRSYYTTRDWDAENSILHSTWLDTTIDMSDTEFKKEMINLANLIIEYQVKFLLSDTRQLQFPIVPELQEWVVETIRPKFMYAKLKKQAIIVPLGIFAQVAMHQTIEEVEQKIHEHQTKFFDTIESAKQWLIRT